MAIRESTIDAAIRDGHYASKQLFSRDRLVAWSHRRRFEVGLRLARRFEGRRILDYGCGDATFLALLFAESTRPRSAVGAELDDYQVDDCRARFRDRPELTFERISVLDGKAHEGAYDGVICMEVLEHVVHIEQVIANLWRVLSHDGVLLVSVPVETGVPLLVKQAVRRVAGWRGIGDYPGTSPYTWREYAASVFAGAQPHLVRPVYGTDTATPFHDHKGFNWRVLREQLEPYFVVEETVASPLPLLGPDLATQVWFVGRKRLAVPHIPST
jgi:SAM-dependent methyltransferase